MPKTTDKDLDILDEAEDEDEGEEEETDESEEEDVESDLAPDDEDEDEEADKPAAKTQSKEDKRIRDLQSKLDTATAELNRLRKAKSGGSEKAPLRDPEVERWMAVAKDATRTRIFESDPRLKDYKIDPAVITGDTPEEMRASAKALLQIVARVETRVRNRTLQEHGFSTPPRESGAEPKRNFAAMSKEEFDRVVKEAVGG